MRCRAPSVLTATGSSSWLPRLCCLDSKQAKLKGSLKIMQIMQRALKASPCWALPRLSLCSCSFCWGKTRSQGGLGAAGEVLPLGHPPAALLGRNLLFPACCTPGKTLLGAAPQLWACLCALSPPLNPWAASLWSWAAPPCSPLGQEVEY